jgi:hypothetical protein
MQVKLNCSKEPGFPSSLSLLASPAHAMPAQPTFHLLRNPPGPAHSHQQPVQHSTTRSQFSPPAASSARSPPAASLVQSHPKPVQHSAVPTCSQLSSIPHADSSAQSSTVPCSPAHFGTPTPAAHPSGCIPIWRSPVQLSSVKFPSAANPVQSPCHSHSHSIPLPS